MNLLSRTQAYLRSVATTVDALSDMVCSSELNNNVDVQYKIIINMIELEQATADFVDEIELTSTAMQAIVISKRHFMKSNERVIGHLEKLQLQGYHFESVISTLKLENDTLKIETELF